MIQKNRIMTKKGIIIFDRNIDVEKTQENGKKVCEVYAPLIQQRIRLKMRLPLHTGSLIQVSSDIKSGNGIESEYINRIMKEGDQVDCFLNYIDEMIEMDEKAGKYLKYKLVDELTDEEITGMLNFWLENEKFEFRSATL